MFLVLRMVRCGSDFGNLPFTDQSLINPRVGEAKRFPPSPKAYTYNISYFGRLRSEGSQFEATPGK
jgi:hypothetical protein